MLTWTTLACSQNDLPTNSYDILYSKNNPSLKYKYDNQTQTHNYSDNWDLDKDGKTDQVYFIGTGGAHLYFYLRIILSSDNKVRDLNFIQSDNPVLPAGTEMEKANYVPEKNNTSFSVFTNKDKSKSVFVKIDDSSFETEKSILKKKGVKTKYLVIYFKDGATQLKDLDTK